MERYRNALENVPLPPEPVLTRWGTWLEAAFFYAIHLEKIDEIIESFDEEEATSIKSAKEALQYEHLQEDLTFIKTHFQILPEAMKKLETVGLPLTESIDLVSGVVENLENIPGNCGKKVRHEFVLKKMNTQQKFINLSTLDIHFRFLQIKKKLRAVLKRNTNFNLLSKVSDILKGANVQGPQEIPPHHWCMFKYAPITSCDVERSFSAYKLIFTDKRHQFTVNNIEKNYCNILQFEL